MRCIAAAGLDLRTKMKRLRLWAENVDPTDESCSVPEVLPHLPPTSLAVDLLGDETSLGIPGSIRDADW